MRNRPLSPLDQTIRRASVRPRDGVPGIEYVAVWFRIGGEWRCDLTRNGHSLGEDLSPEDVRLSVIYTCQRPRPTVLRVVRALMGKSR